MKNAGVIPGHAPSVIPKHAPDVIPKHGPGVIPSEARNLLLHEPRTADSSSLKLLGMTRILLLAMAIVAVPSAVAQVAKPAIAPPPAVATSVAPSVAIPVSTSVATLPYHSKDTSMGVVNCANSLCHGSVEPIKGANILQTEYVTWSRVDKHARAWQTLFSERSLRIAKNLGIGKPSEARICLDCHTHNVPKDRRAERFQVDDGVACEACHGPSGRWLESHVLDKATHEDNLKAGLYPT